MCLGKTGMERVSTAMTNWISILGDACHPYEPFKCPGDGNCISIQYLCDGAPDCPDGYDEDSRQVTTYFRSPICSSIK